MFERCLYFNSNALARAVNRLWNQAFAELELTPAHAYLLRLVLGRPGITQKEIALELKLDKSTVTRFIDALEGRRLLQRKNPSHGDGREHNVFASKKATDMEQRLNAIGDRLYQTMAQTLGKEKLTTLVALLREAEQALK